MTLLSRRNFFGSLIAAAAGSFAAPSALAQTSGRVRFPDYPFKLGVASGCPSSEGVVLWTRLVVDPFDVESLPEASIRVTWEIAEDEAFTKIAKRGTRIARIENAHSVHAEVFGLEAGREYFYRFVAGDEVSSIGRTKTLPIVGTPVNRYKFAVASCQSITDGYFAAYRDVVEQNPDLVLHVGDYIYTSAYIGEDRRIPVAEAVSLNDYRSLYARYKLDPALQASHAACPWVSIWDDHEVQNDWGNTFHLSNLSDKEFGQRKIDALRAYFEHQPLRLSSLLNRNEARIYSRFALGNLLEFNLLDFRQYRSVPGCDRATNGMITSCKPGVRTSMLGDNQERWFERSFGSSNAIWSVIAQTTYMAPFDYGQGDTRLLKADGWDAFPDARQRLLDAVSKRRPRNAVSLGGEIHAYYAGIVHAIAEDPRSKPLLVEFLTTSISSGGGGEERYNTVHKLFSKNTFARYFNNRSRGYLLCDVDQKEWRSFVRAVRDVRNPSSESFNLKTLIVQDGNAEISVQ